MITKIKIKLSMGSGSSNSRKTLKNVNVRCKDESSDSEPGSSDIFSNEGTHDLPDFEQKRANKMKSMIEESSGSGKAITPHEARLYLADADRSSKVFGYRRHIDGCMARLEISENDIDSQTFKIRNGVQR